jgi:hypothetical protein
MSQMAHMNDPSPGHPSTSVLSQDCQSFTPSPHNNCDSLQCIEPLVFHLILSSPSSSNSTHYYFFHTRSNKAKHLTDQLTLIISTMAHSASLTAEHPPGILAGSTAGDTAGDTAGATTGSAGGKIGGMAQVSEEFLERSDWKDFFLGTVIKISAIQGKET